MAKPRTPNQKKKYAALNKRLAKYVSLVRSLYSSMCYVAANIALQTGYTGEDLQGFSFKDYPQVKGKVNDLMRFFSHDLRALVYSGTSEEWKQSNLIQDLLANDVLKAYGMRRHGEKVTAYYQTNNEALKAFQNRRDGGFTVSQKIWNQSYNLKREMELAISSAIEKGTSAITLSKRISKYLNDFPKLQKDYKEKFGKAVDCKDCEYRSIRLARSEINMAYREAEQMRWSQMDFIKGYEIKLSGSHPKEDICDELAGVYPKNFKWSGWHPNDLCFAIPVVMTDDEFWNGTGKPITELPENFKNWCKKNANKILEGAERGNLPYFIKDNFKAASEIIKSEPPAPVAVTQESIGKLVSQGVLSRQQVENIKGILISDKPAAAQQRLHEFITPLIDHSVYTYAELYKSRNPEIAILMSSIKRLNYVDEIQKISLINKLKRLCAEESIKDLSSWGSVNGLKFHKLEPNYYLSHEQTKTTSQGIKVDIPKTVCDLVVFKDHTGKQFAYPVGLTKPPFSASVASKTIAEFPPYFRRGIKRVSFFDRPCPFDPYWRVEYNNPNHVSGATDGGQTSFFITPSSKLQFKGYMAHEGGHILDGGKIFSNSKKWIKATERDDLIYSSVPKMNRISDYARKNNQEDFAECMKAYLLDHDYFKERYPNRAAFIREMAKKLSKR